MYKCICCLWKKKCPATIRYIPITFIQSIHINLFDDVCSIFKNFYLFQIPLAFSFMSSLHWYRWMMLMQAQLPAILRTTPSIPNCLPSNSTTTIQSAVNTKDVMIWIRILFRPFMRYVTQLFRLKKHTYINVHSDTVKGTITFSPTHKQQKIWQPASMTIPPTTDSPQSFKALLNVCSIHFMSPLT